MQIVNSETGEIIFEKVDVADTFFKRFKGLIGRENIDPDFSMVFHNANSIHTCFMRFNIDVIFLDKDMRVVKISHDLKPWRLMFCLAAKSVVECLGGVAGKKGIRVGMPLS